MIFENEHEIRRVVDFANNARFDNVNPADCVMISEAVNIINMAANKFNEVKNKESKNKPMTKGK
jgi:hypothetical protein